MRHWRRLQHANGQGIKHQQNTDSIDNCVGIIVEDVPNVAVEVNIEPEQVPELEPEAMMGEGISLECDQVPVPVAPPVKVITPMHTEHSRSPPPVVLCGLCKENLPRHVLLRCGHALCSTCFDQFEQQPAAKDNQCPFCQAIVESTNPLHLFV